MSEMKVDERFLLPYLLIRVSTIEEILIDKGIISKDDYLSNISKKLDNITEELKNQQ
jgi:hypothetical protein